jgi:hypothetical protein
MAVDWRTVREIVKLVKPDWQASSTDEVTEDTKAYQFTAKVIEEYVNFSCVKCVQCDNKKHYWQMYRCWDCKGWLCEEHVLQHFGPQHVPHPKLQTKYEEEIKALKAALYEARTDRDEVD